ncbi:ECA polysaccharide chain length modulation protein [Dickeya sp. CFBP 2040]|uniref:ECA polysaccharide chain length modulation protein n=1 Tax=Dickeya sp. CFBP 2040 TaxID=2718531 RepID=UPI0014487DD3|nr:ECA polysaccharide chain length modulation protein [Dickeya sp. CFBP 2040]NKI75748.1 ECA polysaccharide chain length modulation protein [Dickeya sp. CFBP 2040]
MKRETLPQAMPLDDELDVRLLCQVLWQGKVWVVGFAVLFALLALVYSWLVQPVWRTSAVTDKPAAAMLSSFFEQQQWLHSLDASATMPDGNAIVEDAYNEFTMQAAAYDTRREFWLQSPYYREHRKGDDKADAILLDSLIDDIQFMPRDVAKKTNDTLKLAADNPQDASNLLRQYVQFANQRAVNHLNQNLAGNWAARIRFERTLLQREETIARAAYDQELKRVTQALATARQQGITEPKGEELSDSALFLQGDSWLQARLDMLKANGPEFDADYAPRQSVLSMLEAGPVLADRFQTYRYLHTPEEPVQRDSPRRGFLVLMGSFIGLLVGAGLVLVRRSI